MKTFKELYEACCAACEKRAEIEEVKEPTGDLKDACWKGYTAVGMKMKNGRKVPNCVPVKEEVEQIDEGVIDSIKRATGFSMPSKHGDTVRGSVVADYLEDNTAHSPKTLDKVRKTKYKLHHIDLETAKRHRDYTNKKVGTGGRDIIDVDKMDSIRRKNVTHDSLVKHPPVIHHDGTILDGNHRIQRAIELKHSKIPVLAPHDWKPRGVNEEVEQIDEMDKAQSQQGGHGVTEPYDYDKGKWSKARIMTNKEVAKKVKFDVGKLLKIAGGKKKVKEEVELDEAADMKTLRKQLAKHTELAVQANKAGDDALTKKHQGHINKIKERMTKLIKEQIDEATFQGKEVPLNKPMAGDVKKSKVYVDPDGDGKAQKVNFGDKNMTIKKHIPGRRKNFRARHNCDNPGPKTKARYWSCKAW